MTVFAKAWQLLEDRIESKTSWGKNELKNEMFLSLRDAALEEDKKEDMNEEFDGLIRRCSSCGLSGINLLIYQCGVSEDRFHNLS